MQSGGWLRFFSFVVCSRPFPRASVPASPQPTVEHSRRLPPLRSHIFWPSIVDSVRFERVWCQSAVLPLGPACEVSGARSSEPVVRASDIEGNAPARFTVPSDGMVYRLLLTIALLCWRNHVRATMNIVEYGVCFFV